MHGPQSALAQSILSNRSNEALSIYNSTRDFFAAQSIECVTHLRRSESEMSTFSATKLLAFARTHSIPAVLSNAVRMLDPTDGPTADILDAARKSVLISERSTERSNSEGYLKSAAEMHYLADEIATAAGERSASLLIKTTLEWADRASLSARRDIGIGSIHLPEAEVFGAKSGEELATQLRARCQSAINLRYDAPLATQATERLDEELTTIRTLGFESYFLTVANIAQAAKAKGIRVAARGSGAGSLTTYLLGISGVEPISRGLLMERFCSPLRNELPDIDIDVESDRRLEIYDDVFAEYGLRCATVSMVERYKSRHAIRDVGAALGISPMEVDALAKAIPRMRARNIATAFEKIPELKKFNTNAPLIKAAIRLAAKLDGLPRNLAMHPCAIALSDIKLRDLAPVQMSASGYPMLQFNKDDVEAIGLLKLDVLGVRMQSAISYSLAEIERVEGAKVDIDAISHEDKATFDLIKSTRTLGLFQIESPGQRELVGKFAPASFNDLIIGISLFRPGPMKSDMISPFLKTRQGLAKRNFIHEDLEEILDETEGVVVYHEQVIRIIAAITGCSFAEGDEKRRKLGTPEGQQEVCDWFYSLAASRGYSKKVVDHIWDILRSFASFGFCKAHAAAFALPTYQSAWLKTHHTAAFIAGALTFDPGMYPKRLLIDEARQWGIEIAPIDINKSDGVYRVERTDAVTRKPYEAPNTASTGEVLTLPDARGYAIRMSLADIKGISSDEIRNIISARPYIDLADFVYRSKASSSTIEALVNIGAFDRLLGVGHNGINRRDIYFHLEEILKTTTLKRKVDSSQLSLELPATEIIPLGLPDISQHEQLRNELQSVGMDLSSHLLTAYSELLNSLKVMKSSDVIKERSGTSVLVAGIKVALQTPPTKSGRRVMFLTIDDGFGCNDLTFFADEQEKFGQIIRGASLILARGEIRRTGPRGISLRATHAWNLESVYESWLKKPSLASI